MPPDCPYQSECAQKLTDTVESLKTQAGDLRDVARSLGDMSLRLGASRIALTVVPPLKTLGVMFLGAFTGAAMAVLLVHLLERPVLAMVMGDRPHVSMAWPRAE
jgi:hypothetical protein